MAARRENVKRKRRGGNACANPLFVKWVEELIQDAEERNLNSKFTYKKVNKKVLLFLAIPYLFQALSALKRYPLPLESGQEAKILDNIGTQGLVSLLTFTTALLSQMKVIR